MFVVSSKYQNHLNCASYAPFLRCQEPAGAMESEMVTAEANEV